MNTSHEVDVLTMDAAHRRAFEDVIGAPLEADQRLLIRVTVPSIEAAPTARLPQSLAGWTAVYDGLSEDQIEAIHRDLNTRADLTRDIA